MLDQDFLDGQMVACWNAALDRAHPLRCHLTFRPDSNGQGGFAPSSLGSGHLRRPHDSSGVGFSPVRPLMVGRRCLRRVVHLPRFLHRIIQTAGCKGIMEGAGAAKTESEAVLLVGHPPEALHSGSTA